MKKLALMTVAALTGFLAFAEMALVPIEQLIRRGKSNSVLVARNVKLTDITRVAGYMAGTDMGVAAPVAPVYAEGYFPAYRNDSDNTGLGFELQAWSEVLQKTVSANVFFYEQGDDLYVYLYQFRNRANAVAAQSLYSAGSYYEPSTALDGQNACLCGLRVWLAGRDRVADYGFWKTAGKTLWEGVAPTSLTDFEAVFTGGYRPYLMHILGYNASDATDVRSVQLQCWGTNNMTRAVHVSVAESGAGIGATLVKARRDNADDGFKVGNNSNYLRNDQASTDTENGSGIAVRGVEARIENRVMTSKYAAYLQDSANRTTVWTNVSLADVLSIDGDLGGGWLSADATDRRPYYLTFGDGQISAQFQAMNDKRLFCVKAVLVQNGANVDGYVEYARYIDLPADGVALGFDFDSGDRRIGDNKIHTADSGSGYGGYGLKNVSAQLVPESGAGVFVWKGGSGTLSQAANWVGGVAPTAGAKLYFRDPTPGMIENDFPAGTAFEGLYFAGSGSNTVVLAGNALTVGTIDNLSDVAAVKVAAPVNCAANFEPLVGGGLAIDSLTVVGTLAPRGTRPLGPLGTVSAAQLSGGNVHAWKGAVYGLGGAFVRQTLNGSVQASFDVLDTAGFTREVFEIAGTNTVAKRLELPNGQIFAVKAGLTSVPDLGPSGDDPHVNLAAGAQLHIRDYKNRYARPVRFEGAGRVSFGATGYAAGRADVFDGVTFATAGADYAIAGAVTPGSDAMLRFAATDPDGTARTITLASAVPAATDIEISSGSLKAAATAVSGKRIVVSGGTYEPVGEVSSPASLTFGDAGGLAATSGASVELLPSSFVGQPKTYCFAAGSSLTLPHHALDLTGATIVYDGNEGSVTDVLTAQAITGKPQAVVSARTGRKCAYSVGDRHGLAVLTVHGNPPGLCLIFK